MTFQLTQSATGQLHFYSVHVVWFGLHRLNQSMYQRSTCLGGDGGGERK